MFLPIISLIYQFIQTTYHVISSRPSIISYYITKTLYHWYILLRALHLRSLAATAQSPAREAYIIISLFRSRRQQRRCGRARTQSARLCLDRITSLTPKGTRMVAKPPQSFLSSNFFSILIVRNRKPLPILHPIKQSTSFPCPKKKRENRRILVSVDDNALSLWPSLPPNMKSLTMLCVLVSMGIGFAASVSSVFIVLVSIHNQKPRTPLTQFRSLSANALIVPSARVEAATSGYWSWNGGRGFLFLDEDSDDGIL